MPAPLNFSLSENFLRKSIARKEVSPSNSENIPGLSRAKLYLSAFNFNHF